MCVEETALPVCGATALCYKDYTCTKPSEDEHDGLGCNAGDVDANCRFCGGDDEYSGIICPTNITIPPFDIAGLSIQLGAILGPIFLLCCVACCLHWKRRRRMARERDERRLDAKAEATHKKEEREKTREARRKELEAQREEWAGTSSELIRLAELAPM